MRADTEQEILKTELWWTALVSAIVTAIMLAIIYAGVVHHINPPSKSNPQASQRLSTKTIGSRLAPQRTAIRGR